MHFRTLIGLFALSSITSLSAAAKKKLIIDTDIFSDVDDSGALLVASTHPNVDLLAVVVNTQSQYSPLTVSAILNHYNKSNVPIGALRPLTNETFFDDYTYLYSEYTSKVAYHYGGGQLEWGGANAAWDPVSLYRKVLAAQEDGSVAIASIGYFENLSGLLNSTGDKYSKLSGPELIRAKVSELSIMGGQYPSGSEFNFNSDNPYLIAQVVRSWPGKITYLGNEVGMYVPSAARFTVEGPSGDPVKAAYTWYLGYGQQRPSWDPLTVLYAIEGLGDLFEYGVSYGYNYVYPNNGSNTWVYDKSVTDQHYLRLKVDNATAGTTLDNLFLDGAWAAAQGKL